MTLKILIYRIEHTHDYEIIGKIMKSFLFTKGLRKYIFFLNKKILYFFILQKFYNSKDW